MPIQVITSYKRIPPPPVVLESAGDDVFPLCDTIIYLELVVDSIPNLEQGHTILWEQLSGTPVTLINDDQRIASYVQLPLDETDKVFRVILDQYYPEEQRSTVTVYATPTSIMDNFSAGDTKHFTPAEPVDYTTIDVSTSALVPPPAGGHDDDVLLTDVFSIFWDLPPDALLIPYLTQMTLFENDIAVATYSSTDVLEYSGGPEVYNVLTEYIVDAQPSNANSRKVDFFGTTVPSTRAIDDTFDGLAFPSDSTVSKFPNVVRVEISVFPESGFSGADVNVGRFINNNEAVDLSPLSTAFAIGTTTIFRTDPGGIGGG